MAMTCQIARYKLAKFVEGLKAPGMAEKTSAMVKASMVAGVSAPAKGLVGNAAWGGYRLLAGQPTEAALDYIQAVGKSAATGFKVPAREFREVVNGTDMAGLREFGKGMQRGADQSIGGFKAGYAAAKGLPKGTPFAERIAAMMNEVDAVMSANAQKVGMNNPVAKFKSPAARAFVEGAFALLEVVDRPFFEGSYDLSVYMQAKLNAVKQGLSGAARDAEVSRLLAAPTDEMLTRALLDAQYATFKDKTIAAKGIESFRRNVQKIADDTQNPVRSGAGRTASFLMDVTVPFTGVPTSVAKKGVEMTPMGLLLSEFRNGTQAQRSRAGANALLGSSGIALGYQMYKDGKITLESDKSANQRADDDAVGRRPYSIKLGDNWVDIRVLGPVAIPLFIGGTMARKKHDDPNATPVEQAASGTMAIGRNVVENTYAQGVKRAIDAVKDEKSVASFATGLVPVPALLGQAGRAIDDTPREATTPAQRLMNRTPLSLLLPEKQSSLGTLPNKTMGERLSAFSPLPISKDRSTREMDELRRLGVTIGKPERSTTINKKKTDIPAEAYHGMVDAQGTNMLRLIGSLMNSPGYRQADDEAKKNALESLIRQKKAAARNPVRQDLSKLLFSESR